MSLLGANIFSTILSLILTILADILCIYFIKNICFNKDNDINLQQQSINKSNKQVTVVSTIIFLSFVIAVNLSSVSSIIFHTIGPENDNINVPLGVLINICYQIGIMGIILIFILRIIYTFNSIQSYSKNIIKILCISFTIMIMEIPLLISSVIYGIFPWAYIISFILIIHYIINYLMCFTLFMKKVIMMTRYKIDNYLVSKSDDNLNQEMVTISTNTMNDNEQEIEDINDNNDGIGNNVIFEIGSIDLLVRYSLMVLIGFISTFIALISGIIVIIIYSDEDHDFENMVFRIDSFINLLCIYLLFGFGKQLYYTICVNCDRCLKNCVLNKMIKGDIDNGDNTNDDNKDKLSVEQTKMILFETL